MNPVKRQRKGAPDRFASQLEENRAAASMFEHLAHRGAYQAFYVTPKMPPVELDSAAIARAWKKTADGIRRGKSPEILSLYIHIPFCPRLCRYCIYYRELLERPEQMERYLESLHAQIDYYAPIFKGLKFTTGYIGGGTPTLLDEKQIRRLCGRIEGAFPMKGGGEWSFETSPYTFSESKAAIFREFGYNRVSFGVQSFDLSVLKSVNRTLQKTRQISDMMGILERMGFIINIDMIHGLPGETVESTIANLKHVLSLDPDQVTYYQLNPWTPELPGPIDRTPLPELVKILSPTAEALGYSLMAQNTCLGIKKHMQKSPADMEVYNDVTVNPQSLLAIGPTGRSYIYGRMFYLNDKYPLEKSFDPHVKIANGVVFPARYENGRYLATKLSTTGLFNVLEYRNRFKETVSAGFGEVLKNLVKHGRLEKNGNIFAHVTDDKRERFITEAFFVNGEMKAWAVEEEMMKRRFTKASNPANSVGIRVQGAGLELPFKLVKHNEGDPYCHRNGRFAFLLPEEANPLIEERHNEAQALISAFSRIFDEAVAGTEGDDVRALEKSIMAVMKKPAGGR